MRCLIFVLLGILAVYSAPVAENDETAAFMAEFDSEDQLAPMEDEELTLSKRLVPDQTIEDCKYQQETLTTCFCDMNKLHFQVL